MVSISSSTHSLISFSALGIIFLILVEFSGLQVSEQELHCDQSPFLQSSTTIKKCEMDLNETIFFNYFSLNVTQPHFSGVILTLSNPETLCQIKLPNSRDITQTLIRWKWWFALIPTTIRFFATAKNVVCSKWATLFWCAWNQVFASCMEIARCFISTLKIKSYGEAGNIK